MDERVLISVIIPIYKSEKYLSQCIESVIFQTLIDFELLLIDDGSPDACGRICDEYASIDKRIRVFHQINSGVSSARNRGLIEACGKYVAFVDSDDYVKPNYLENLYATIRCESGIDLAIQNIERVNIDGGKKVIPLPECLLEGKDKSLILTQYVRLGVGYSCCKLYLLSKIKDNHIYFIPNLSLLEDLFFLLDYILCADKIMIGNHTDYVYRMGISTSLSNDAVYSFEGECNIYVNYFDRICLYKDYFNLDDSSLNSVWKNLTLLFHRILLSIYRNNYSRKKRIYLLSTVLNEHYFWVKHYFSPEYKVDKVLKLILLNRQYAIFDGLMIVLLRVKLKKMFGSAV
ncbi:glycosyltransferase [Bacteroidaceae bacterium HV4-6-C5C]|nr:glycosyltransferase [Bacteroidaceae bacterium HV4-6-C5C]